MTASIQSGFRVMVVEDELLIAMLIEDTLADHDCSVTGPYTTLAAALEAAAAVEVDAAILDVNLRGEKVFPIAEILSSRGIPFILLTGYGPDAAPADRPHWIVCEKPFSPPKLAALVLEQIAASRSVRPKS